MVDSTTPRGIGMALVDGREKRSFRYARPRYFPGLQVGPVRLRLRAETLDGDQPLSTRRLRFGRSC